MQLGAIEVGATNDLDALGHDIAFTVARIGRIDVKRTRLDPRCVPYRSQLGAPNVLRQDPRALAWWTASDKQSSDRLTKCTLWP
uniref:Uncharacterized protein n=1 Tax=Arundo donax TaxID=35708 RepID=A0A0A9BAV3_ARUDO